TDKELMMQIGYNKVMWPLALMKELRRLRPFAPSFPSSGGSPPRSNRKRSPLVGPAIEKDKRSCSKDLAKYFSTSKTVPLDVIPRAQSTTCIKQEDGGNYRWGKLSKSAFSLTK